MILIIIKDGKKVIEYRSHLETPAPVKEFRNVGIQQGPPSIPPKRKSTRTTAEPLPLPPIRSPIKKTKQNGNKHQTKPNVARNVVNLPKSRANNSEQPKSRTRKSEAKEVEPKAKKPKASPKVTEKKVVKCQVCKSERGSSKEMQMEKENGSKKLEWKGCDSGGCHFMGHAGCIGLVMTPGKPISCKKTQEVMYLTKTCIHV